MNGIRRANHSHVMIMAITMLTLAALACSFNLNSNKKTPNETEISKSVEQTLASEETLTAEAKPTEEPGFPTLDVTSTPLANSTIQAQQATMDAQATMLAQPTLPVPPTPELPATTTPQLASTEPILLKDWNSQSMRQAPGCGEDRNGPPCWFGLGEELDMMLDKPVLIDPAWPNPYLVFTHRYEFIQDATIYIKGDKGWEVLWSFPSGRVALWTLFQVALSKYKGQEVLFHLTVAGRSRPLHLMANRNEWNIQNPEIVPDYKPK